MQTNQRFYFTLSIFFDFICRSRIKNMMLPKIAITTGIKYGCKIDFVKKSSKNATQQANISKTIHTIDETGISINCLPSFHLPVKKITMYSKINTNVATINIVHTLYAILPVNRSYNGSMNNNATIKT